VLVTVESEALAVCSTARYGIQLQCGITGSPLDSAPPINALLVLLELSLSLYPP
jgi:hypothetical protein